MLAMCDRAVLAVDMIIKRSVKPLFSSQSVLHFNPPKKEHMQGNDKRGSVVYSHLSRSTVASTLKQRIRGSNVLILTPTVCLASPRVYVHRTLLHAACALTDTVQPLPLPEGSGRYSFLSHLSYAACVTTRQPLAGRVD